MLPSGLKPSCITLLAGMIWPSVPSTDASSQVSTTEVGVGSGPHDDSPSTPTSNAALVRRVFCRGFFVVMVMPSLVAAPSEDDRHERNAAVRRSTPGLL